MDYEQNYYTQQWQEKNFSQFDKNEVLGGRNYNPSLWVVDDRKYKSVIDEPREGDKEFLYQHFETYGEGVFDSVMPARGMCRFIEHWLQMFATPMSPVSTLNRAISALFSYLDYSDPYYLVTDMPIKVGTFHWRYTFKDKRTMSTLNPDEIESFIVDRKWKFLPYNTVHDLVSHPMVARVIRGEALYSDKGKLVTVDSVLNKIVTIVYGDYAHRSEHTKEDSVHLNLFIQNVVEEFVFNHFQEVEYDMNLHDDHIGMLDSYKRMDTRAWTVVFLAGMTWLKSPFSLPYLCAVHPIYTSLLEESELDGTINIRPKTDGYAIAKGWELYTGEELYMYENLPPKTCASCSQPLHCTKYVNTAAIAQSVCSCGKPIMIDDTDLSEHMSSACAFYARTTPPVLDWLCHRCMYLHVENAHRTENYALGKDTLCSRTICPAVECKFHPGKQAYVNALQKNRLNLIPHLPNTQHGV